MSAQARLFIDRLIALAEARNCPCATAVMVRIHIPKLRHLADLVPETEESPEILIGPGDPLQQFERMEGD